MRERRGEGGREGERKVVVRTSINTMATDLSFLVVMVTISLVHIAWVEVKRVGLEERKEWRRERARRMEYPFSLLEVKLT